MPLGICGSRAARRTLAIWDSLGLREESFDGLGEGWFGEEAPDSMANPTLTVDQE